MEKYKNSLLKLLQVKQKKLQELMEQRNTEAYRENFWHIQSGINNLSTDIATIKSRLANLNNTGINLPDHQTVHNTYNLKV